MTSPHICFLGIAPTIGDTAIGQSILHALKSRTELPVRVHTNRPDVFQALPELGGDDVVLPALPPITAPPLRSPAFALRLRRLLRDLRATGGARTLPRETHTALRDALHGCAAVVLQGGPNWNDRMIDRRRAFERWFFLETARAYGCRVYHVGVSCGPFAWPLRRRLLLAPLCRAALSSYDMLVVRDAFSIPSLKRLGVRTPAVESTDAAVFLPSRSDDAFADVERRILAHSGRPRVVVAVRDFQPAYGFSAELRSRVLGELARTLDHVQRELGDVFFLSTDHNPQSLKKTDVEIAHAVQGMMRTPGSTVIDVDIGIPSALKHIYGHFDAMVSMRLHPTILALGGGVPCLLLSYDSKCDDFFARLRLNDFVLPLATFHAPAAIERVSRMLRDSAIRDHITSQYGALRRAHADDWEPMFEQIAGRAREIAGGAAAGGVRRPGGDTRVRRAG